MIKEVVVSVYMRGVDEVKIITEENFVVELCLTRIDEVEVNVDEIFAFEVKLDKNVAKGSLRIEISINFDDLIEAKNVNSFVLKIVVRRIIVLIQTNVFTFLCCKMWVIFFDEDAK